MKKNNNNTKEEIVEIKEFTASDVKSMHESVDEKNGFGIDYIIRMRQINRQIIADRDKLDKSK